jgi:ATP-dependent Clp protease adaptor protein ClpS
MPQSETGSAIYSKWEYVMADDQERTDQANPTAVADEQKAATRPRKTPPQPMRPWKVILHNDDVNVFEDVVLVIRKLTSLTKRESILRTLEAHEKGAALLLVTHKERAELYVEQFASCGLTVTSEPDEA